MRLTCSIQPRATCVVLVTSSITTLAAIAALIATLYAPRPACECAHVAPMIVDGPAIQYASSVRSFSTEYSPSSWSAMQALGAPDVYPRYGDDARAWASREADDAIETIELGFAQPQRTNALLVYETFNPGAIASVELVTERGGHLVVKRSNFQPTGGAAVSTFGTTCTTERIVAARITIESGKVAGWNEIDAVGLLPCP